MQNYINSIVATVVVCKAVTLFSPSKDSTRVYIKLLCALAITLTLLSPIRTLSSSATKLALEVYGFFEGTSHNKVEGDGGDSEMASLAYLIMKAVGDRVGINDEDISVTIVTTDDGELAEIQMYLAKTAYADRERVRELLEGEFEVPIYVFSER